MPDPEQLRKEQDALSNRLGAVEKTLAKKANKEEKQELPFGAMWSDKDWKANLTAFVEIVTITKATSLIKFGLPALFDGGKIIESFIEKRFKRNKWGWLFGKKPEDPLVPLEERLRAAEGRLVSDEMTASVARFDSQYPAARSDRIHSDIQSLKTKVQSLEGHRDRVQNRANATPPPRRSSVNGISNFAQAADQISRLEDRITHLARALG
ncbi:hypothetical protein AB0M94_26905 [Streptomyces xanthochromogenes]|uniref:hypothetical protein n=1 Tax=Streptomyces xanthochromogenes TaxID=67384 RepID=UPI003440259D